MRICRKCSGLQSLLELGSYSDVESALLINDAYEILQGRYKNLHLLRQEDLNDLKSINVKRRGTSVEVPLLQVLKERLLKTKINEEVKQQNLLLQQHEAETATATAFPYMTIMDQSVNSPVENVISIKTEDIGNNIGSIENSFDSMFKDRDDRNIQINFQNDDVNNLIESSLLLESFSNTIASLKEELLLWKFVSTSIDASTLIDVLVTAVRSINTTSEKTISTIQAMLRMNQFLCDQYISKHLMFSIVSSFFPGESCNQIAAIYLALNDSVSQEIAPFGRFKSSFATTTKGIHELNKSLSLLNKSMQTISENQSYETLLSSSFANVQEFLM